jgi:hypothetical protein
MLEPSGACPTSAPVLERACLVHTQHSAQRVTYAPLDLLQWTL